MSRGSYLLACFVFLLVILYTAWANNANRTIHDVVLTRDAERVCSSSTDGASSCKYLVFTDKGEFQNSDSIWHFKFNSSTLHSKMVKGAECKITTVWYRIEILSMYPNIIKAECVNAEEN